jgi:hypothetical protein
MVGHPYGDRNGKRNYELGIKRVLSNHHGFV